MIPIKIYWEIHGKWGWPANKFTHSESTLEILPKIPSMIFLLKIYFLASSLSLNYLLFCVILLNLPILYPHPSTSDTLLASPQALLMLWYSQFFIIFTLFIPLLTQTLPTGKTGVQNKVTCTSEKGDGKNKVIQVN